MTARTRNILIGVLVVAVILACIGLALAWIVGRHALGVAPGSLGNWRFGGPHMRLMRWPMFMAGPLVGLIALAAIGGLVWWAVSAGRGRPGVSGPAAGPGPAAQPGPVETPLDILKRRYAAGEISREQYEQMRQDLE